MTVPSNQLPNGARISSLGLGCSSYWAKPAFPERNAVDLVLRAFALGINHFDTGPSYAAGGAERRLSLALKQLQRERLIISTKAGTYIDPQGAQFKSFDPARVREGLQESLQRLGIAYVDILYLHGPTVDNLSVSVIDCLNQLKEDGLIRYSGVNSFDRRVLRKVVGLPIDVVMPQYSVFDVSCAQDVEALVGAGKMIVSGTALGQGLIDLRSLLPTSKKSLWYLLRALKNDPLLPVTGWQARQRVRAIGRPSLEAALLFLQRTPGIKSSVFGTTSIQHLEANAAAAARIANPV